MQPDPIDVFLLDRYIAGAATPDEAAVVDAWITKRPDNAQLFEILRGTFGATPETAPQSDADAVWARFNDRLASTQVAAEKEDTTVRLKLHRTSGARSVFNDPSAQRKLWLIAGTIAAVAASLLIVVRTQYSPQPESVAPMPPRQYAASKGQRAELRLADGTRVVLAPDSRLTVPADYDSTSRTVILEGQGYFDVVHNEAKPFSVKAGLAVVRDLGTRFDVRAFANESSVRVVVTEGKVQLVREQSGLDSARLLVAGQLGRVRRSGETSAAVRVDTTRFVSWTKGILVFDRTPVLEALAELARWYDVDINLASASLRDLTLTATLRDQSLTEVLNVVALALHASAERQGRIVTLRPL